MNLGIIFFEYSSKLYQIDAPLNDPYLIFLPNGTLLEADPNFSKPFSGPKTFKEIPISSGLKALALHNMVHVAKQFDAAIAQEIPLPTGSQ